MSHPCIDSCGFLFGAADGEAHYQQARRVRSAAQGCVSAGASANVQKCWDPGILDAFAAADFADRLVIRSQVRHSVVDGSNKLTGSIEMALFLVAVIQKPTPQEAQNGGTDKLVGVPEIVLAFDNNQAIAAYISKHPLPTDGDAGRFTIKSHPLVA